MSDVRKLFKESLSTFIFQILLVCLAFIVNVFISRILGPEGKGEYDVIITFTFILRMLSLLGLDIAAAHFLGSKILDRQTVTYNIFFIGIISTLIFTLSSLFFWSFVPLKYSLENYLFISTVPLSGLTLLSGFILLGSDKVLNYNVLESGKNFFYLIFLSLIFLLMGLNYVKISFCYLSSIFFTFILGLLFLYRYRLVDFKDNKFSFEYIKKLLNFGKYPYISGFLSFLVYRVDVFIVYNFLGASATGIYGIAVVFVELMKYISKSMQLVVIAKIPTYKNLEGSRNIVLIMKFIFLILLFTGIVFIKFGKPLIVFMFSEKFLDSSLLIIYLVPGIIFLGLSQVMSGYLIARGLVKIFILSNLCALLLNVLLDIIYIPIYELTAASISTSIAYFASFIIILTYFLRKEKLELSVFLPRRSDVKIIKGLFSRNNK
ncbi:MAG: oligosaccharide flippase family protein [Candidatus Helarchaeota archaeon]|nr:oligosaccharide flippase family protein [Candidatus Helarchaeota archaeon]